MHDGLSSTSPAARSIHQLRSGHRPAQRYQADDGYCSLLNDRAQTYYRVDPTTTSSTMCYHPLAFIVGIEFIPARGRHRVIAGPPEHLEVAGNWGMAQLTEAPSIEGPELHMELEGVRKDQLKRQPDATEPC